MIFIKISTNYITTANGLIVYNKFPKNSSGGRILINSLGSKISIRITN